MDFVVVLLQGALGLLMLFTLELVLGIDNMVMISIVSGGLPEVEASKARRIGMILAILSRLFLLFFLSKMTALGAPLFHISTFAVTYRTIVFLGGGLFLLGKSTIEIRKHIEGEKEGESEIKKKTSFASVVWQIIVMDAVFSLDTIMTAVGTVSNLWIMATAVVLAVIFMMIFVNKTSAFIKNNPSVKMLALSFLLLIGTVLVAEAFGTEIPKSIIYSCLAFSSLFQVFEMKRTAHKKE